MLDIAKRMSIEGLKMTLVKTAIAESLMSINHFLKHLVFPLHGHFGESLSIIPMKKCWTCEYANPTFSILILRDNFLLSYFLN